MCRYLAPVNRLLLLLLGALWGSCITRGQADSTVRPFPRAYPGFFHDEITLQTAYHQGRYGFAELGVGRSMYGMMHHPFGFSYCAGAEVRVDRPELWGVKVGAYLTGGAAFGVNLIHYMEVGRSMQVLRPEIGCGIFKAKVTYAYNVRLTGQHLDGVNTHMLTVSYAFRVKRLRNDDVRRKER